LQVFSTVLPGTYSPSPSQECFIDMGSTLNPTICRKGERRGGREEVEKEEVREDREEAKVLKCGVQHSTPVHTHGTVRRLHHS
jgi:hypothetical protein